MTTEFQPAFPILDSGGLGTLQLRHPGMPQRLWLAGHAMVFVARAAEMDHVGPQELAAACFEYADAILLESEQPGPVRENYERQLSNERARGDRMLDALSRLVTALLPSDTVDDHVRPAFIHAQALIDDEENVPF